MDITDWNVRIIQNGEVIEDSLYNIYDDLSICFDENEGNFLHKDYKEALKQTDIEHRTPLLPQRNFHIASHDYFSVSVSLETYLKMLKGEKKFPHELSGRKGYDIFSNSLADVPEDLKKYLKNIYSEL